MGERRVWVERARRTSLGALGSRDNWDRKAFPTPPTPGFVSLFKDWWWMLDLPMTPR